MILLETLCDNINAWAKPLSSTMKMEHDNFIFVLSSKCSSRNLTKQFQISCVKSKMYQLLLQFNTHLYQNFFLIALATSLL